MAKTYSYFRRHQVNLVKDEHQVLVRRFCANVLLDRTTARTLWISGIEDMQDDIGRIDDLKRDKSVGNLGRVG